MPAKSKAQQKFMGMVHAAQKGEKPASKEVAKAAKGMGKKDAKDFASTKHKGLPEKAKKSKTEESLLNAFEEHIAEVKITSGPNKGKEWSPKTPGPTNPNYKPFDKNGIPSPDDGATAPPPGYKAPKAMKKAEVTPTTTSSDDVEMTAEAKQTYGGKGKQMTKIEHDAESKKKKEKQKMKKMAEALVQIGRLEQMIFEAKKTKNKDEEPKEGNAFGKAVSDAKKDGVQKGEKVKVGGKEIPVKESNKEKECNHTPKGKKCPVHGLKECSSGMYEGNDGNLANNAKPYDKVTRGDVVAGRLGKDEMGGKSKKKKVKEGWTHDSLAAELFESGDEYVVSLHNRLSKQLKG